MAPNAQGHEVARLVRSAAAPIFNVMMVSRVEHPDTDHTLETYPATVAVPLVCLRVGGFEDARVIRHLFRFGLPARFRFRDRQARKVAGTHQKGAPTACGFATV